MKLGVGLEITPAELGMELENLLVRASEDSLLVLGMELEKIPAVLATELQTKLVELVTVLEKIQVVVWELSEQSRLLNSSNKP